MRNAISSAVARARAGIARALRPRRAAAASTARTSGS